MTAPELDPAGVAAAAAALAAIRARDSRRTMLDPPEDLDQFDARRAAEVVSAYLDAAGTPKGRRSLTGGDG